MGQKPRDELLVHTNDDIVLWGQPYLSQYSQSVADYGRSVGYQDPFTSYYLMSTPPISLI